MVISVASQKGGTGKTSTSISLAAGLAHKGKRVLLIDIDSQANSSKVLLHHYPTITKDQTIYGTILDRAPLVVHQTHVPNLSIVPSHILLSNTDIELTTAKDHREGCYTQYVCNECKYCYQVNYARGSDFARSETTNRKAKSSAS